MDIFVICLSSCNREEESYK